MPVAYCSVCGKPTAQEVPAGDNLMRDVCTACGEIHYDNPRILAGTLPVHDGRILLCERAIEPRTGYWTLPCGFLEAGESAEEGAARETMEEAGAIVTIERLFTAFSLPHVNQVYLLYLSTLETDALDPGPESLDARFFQPNEIPWARIAFRAIEFSLDHYVNGDRAAMHAGVYRRAKGDPWILYNETKGLE